MRIFFTRIKKFLTTLILLILPLAFQAQSATDPSSISKKMPNWVGAFVAALIFGGIIFSILRRIGAEMTWKKGRPFWKTFFTYLGYFVWVVVFLIFLFIL